MRSLTSKASATCLRLPPNFSSRPRICCSSTVFSETGCSTDDADVGIANVYVSAKIFDPTAQDEKDKVVIQAGTLTDEQGYYSLFVMPDAYNLVVYIDGKEFAFVKVETLAGETLENSDITDFQLVDASAMGTIYGEVSINGADAEQYALSLIHI